MGLTISDYPQLSSNIMQGSYTTESSDGWGILSTNQQEDTYAPSDILSIYQQEDTSASSTQSLLEITSDLESGAGAEVSGSAVTLSDSEGTQSLQINPRDSLAVLESGEEGMIISNETTGEAINFKRGESVEVAGSGQFEMFASETSSLFGGSERVRLETGESATLTDEGEGLVLLEDNFTGETSVPEDGSAINVTGETDEQMTLANLDGENLSFSPGDEAEVRRTEDGLQFENITSGETLTVQSGDILTATGEAELDVGEGMEVEGDDTVEASITSTEATLENTTVRESVSVAAGDTESTSDLSLLSGYSSPQTAQMSLFGSLVSELI